MPAAPRIALWPEGQRSPQGPRKRSKTKTCFGADALMRSVPKTTWSDYYVQKLRHLSVGRLYRFSDKLILGIFTLTWILTWFMVVPVSFFAPFQEWILVAFAIRWILLIVLFHKASRKLGEPFEAWNHRIFFGCQFPWFVVQPNMQQDQTSPISKLIWTAG